MAFRQTMKAGRKHGKKSRRASKRSRRASRKSRRGRKMRGGCGCNKWPWEAGFKCTPC